MSGLVFTLLLATISLGILNSILAGDLGFDTIAKGEAWHGRVREGRWNVEVFIKRLGKELEFLLPDGSVPKEVCEKVVKRLSAKIYSLIMREPFQQDYIKVVGPTPSFCYYCLESVYMPFRCYRCGGFFCGKHRLPERHNCPGGEKMKVPTLREGREEGFEKPERAIIVKKVPCG